MTIKTKEIICKTAGEVHVHPKHPSKQASLKNIIVGARKKQEKNQIEWKKPSEIERCQFPYIPCNRPICKLCNEFPYTLPETEDERKERVKTKMEGAKTRKLIRETKKEVAKGRQSTILCFFK